ncbi:MAG: transporter substrate-binding domain-containing protein [Alphaproteobacteria bacterium]
MCKVCPFKITSFCRIVTACLAAVYLLAAAPGLAQEGQRDAFPLLEVPDAPPPPAVDPDGPVIPNFWDLRARMDRPDPDAIQAIRFLVNENFPPFSFLDRRGLLIGFDIDIARAVCAVLKVRCAVQFRPFATLRAGLLAGDGDAIIAGLAQDAPAGAGLAFTRPYMKIPARFVTARIMRFDPLRPPAGNYVGVVCQSAHKAYAERYFGQLSLVCYQNLDTALAEVRGGRIVAVFGDALTLGQLLNTERFRSCCAYAGGPYVDDAHFGRGLMIALRPDDVALRHALDYALREVYRNGTWAELYLRYFPLGLF